MGVDAKRILLINELADYLKISTSTLYQWAQEGKLPRRKLSITSRTIRMSLVSG
ncbi:MAG: helix-turn-helix domain-containing protein [Proteobacteria bacterium]|nr:helix-turn-helix domain-containing protein [Pseudomonadota bacterium]